jgi:chorismate mutase/prephenate dehydratase
MSEELNTIREQIDSIDNQVHDLLMQRASLVSSVAAAKLKGGLQIVQPAREARMIRRLLRRHSGPLPQATIVRIWRELVGSVSLLQTGLTVAVSATEAQSLFWDMAKNYFGSSVPMKKIAGNPHTLAALREDEVSFAVLSWPEVEDNNPWWTFLFDPHSSDISIICALPYGAEKKQERAPQSKAVIISKIEFRASDEDATFIGIKTSTDVSRAKINDMVAKAGFKIFNIYSAQTKNNLDHHTLVEVKGYFKKGSPEILKLRDIIGDLCLYCDTLGGYPVIPELKKARVGA